MAQDLFDTLSGAFGHPIDRPGINAAVANSQSLNGLRTAQTNEAMLNAQLKMEELAAHGDLENSLQGVTGQDGKPMLQPSEAHLVAKELIGKFGDAKTVMEALRATQHVKNTDTESNPANLNTPALTAAVAGNTDKVPEAINVPDNYYVPPGVTPPTVLESPLGAAKAKNQGSTGNLKQNEADNPQLYHPSAAGLPAGFEADVAEFIRQNPNLATNIRSLVSNGGASVVHALMHPDQYAHPGNTPPPAPGATPPAAGAPPAAVAPLAPAPGGINASGANLKEQADIKHAFASGVESRQATSLNTLAQHANLFDLIADQLQNGNSVPTNAIRQLWGRTMGGSPVPTNLQIAAGFLGREAIRATVNSGAGTGQERELQVSENSPPAALHGAADTLRTLTGGQYHSLDVKARRGGVDLSQIAPDAAGLMTHSPVKTPAPAGTGVVPAFNSVEEAELAGKKAGDVVKIGGVEGTLK